MLYVWLFNGYVTVFLCFFRRGGCRLGVGVVMIIFSEYCLLVIFRVFYVLMFGLFVF